MPDIMDDQKITGYVKCTDVTVGDPFFGTSSYTSIYKDGTIRETDFSEWGKVLKVLNERNINARYNG